MSLMRTAWCMPAPSCDLTASWRVACAQAGSLCEERHEYDWNGNSNDGHRRRECNADPHGTSLRRARGHAPGSARCRRAPAFAFVPRTASGKASSVLACRRRVCGRLCTALWSSCSVSSSVSGVPASRAVCASVLTARRRSGSSRAPSRAGRRARARRRPARTAGSPRRAKAARSALATSRARTGTRRRCPRRSCRRTRAHGCRPSRPCSCWWHPDPPVGAAPAGGRRGAGGRCGAVPCAAALLRPVRLPPPPALLPHAPPARCSCGLPPP